MKRKRIWGAIGLLVLMYMSQAGNAISELGRLGFDHKTAERTAVIYSVCSICLISLIMMAVPICTVIMRKGKLDYESGKKLCRNNSIVLFIISMISLGIIGFGAVGGVGAIIYYFINKWLFVEEKEKVLDDEANEISPKNEADLDEGNCMTDASDSDQSQEIPKMSLSVPGDKFEPKGSFNIYGSDIVLRNDTEGPAANPYQSAPQIEDEPTESPAQSAPQKNNPLPVKKISVRYCSRCGYWIDSDTKKCTGCGKQYFKGIPPMTAIKILWGILIALSITLNIVLLATVNKLQNTTPETGINIKQLQEEMVILKEKLRANSEKIEFVDDFCAFVEDDGSNLYHKFECSRFKGESFWVYNINAAKQNGCRPCPLCCD